MLSTSQTVNALSLLDSLHYYTYKPYHIHITWSPKRKQETALL